MPGPISADGFSPLTVVVSPGCTPLKPWQASLIGAIAIAVSSPQLEREMNRDYRNLPRSHGAIVLFPSFNTLKRLAPLFRKQGAQRVQRFRVVSEGRSPPIFVSNRRRVHRVRQPFAAKPSLRALPPGEPQAKRVQKSPPSGELFCRLERLAPLSEARRFFLHML